MGFASVTERFFEWVQRTPEAPAVCEGPTVTYTYAELGARALQIGAYLTAQGVGTEDLVGIQWPRSPEYIASILGVWAAGAAWVYLDPKWPEARRAQVCSEGKIRLILQHSLPRVEPRTLACIASHDLAYAVWTSGSTGQPKGVLVEHAGLMSMLEQQVEAFGLGPQKRALLTLKPSFDASVSDVASALISGAALVIDAKMDAAFNPEHLLRAISEGGVTHADIPPALLPFIGSQVLPPSLEALVIGGEVPDPVAVRACAAKVRVVSVYGPTEATVCTSMVRCTINWSSPDIGSPKSGVRYEVRDHEGLLVDSGSSGELWIGGPQVARGYLLRPELTAERFKTRDGLRWFSTRDRVRQSADGSYQFLGRLDRQFKLHGQLVAPEEVEAVLLSHPGVARAQVGKVNERLVGLVQPSAADLDVQDVLRWARQKLAAYLVPARLDSIPDWPLTDSGKVDAHALWKSTKSRAPVSLDCELQALAEAVLGCPVDPLRSFVGQGADSMGVLRLAAACEAQGLEISASDLGSDRPLGALRPEGDGALSVEALQDRVCWTPAEAGSCAQGPVRTWLMTGVTGFVGAQILLAQAALDPDSKWVLLVRAEDSIEARNRVRRACEIKKPGAFDSLLSRFEVIVGDISRPELGLSPPTYNRLLQAVEGVHHVAADVHALASASALWASNVQGTQNMLDFVLRGRVQVVVYASTLSVFVHTDSNQGVVLEGDSLDATQWVYGGYSQTKWVAERLLASITKPGLRKLCLRYGLITADVQAGPLPQKDLFVSLVRGLAQGGLVPRGSFDPWMDMTPVDWAANVAGALATDPSADGCYHITAGRVRWSQLCTALQRTGVHLKAVTPEDFASAALEATPEFGSALLSLGGLLGAGSQHRGLQLFQDTSMLFDDRRRRAALPAASMRAPRVDPALLERYVRRILGGDP